MTKLRANNQSIELSHEEKIYFPEDGITKRDLIDYYAHMAPIFLPYVRNRLLTLQRFPGGIHAEAFYQKNAPDYFPPWIATKRVKKKTGGSDDYIMCNDKATLIYVVNQACITPHVWLSTVDKLNYPNCIIWDLDPPQGRPVDFSLVVRVAQMVRDIVIELGLEPFVMTTGSRGVHVRVPIKQEYTFDKVRVFARAVAHKIVEADPEHITLEARKIKRGDCLLIDVMRNGYGATAVSPYAVRALPTAPVATPISWEELTARGMHAQRYTMMNLGARLEKQGDLWKHLQRSQRSLKQVMARLKGLG
jgi:bifunctional non-homologous end joining protein LigD